jgi:hypothetical protein
VTFVLLGDDTDDEMEHELYGGLSQATSRQGWNPGSHFMYDLMYEYITLDFAHTYKRKPSHLYTK